MWLSALYESEQKQFDNRTKGIHICYCSHSRARNLNELWPTTMTPGTFVPRTIHFAGRIKNWGTIEYKFIMQRPAAGPRRLCASDKAEITPFVQDAKLCYLFI